MWEINHLDNRKWGICANIAIDASHYVGNQMAQANHLYIEKSNYLQLRKHRHTSLPWWLNKNLMMTEMIKLYYLTENQRVGAYPSLTQNCSMQINISQSNKEDYKGRLRKLSFP